MVALFPPSCTSGNVFQVNPRGFVSTLIGCPDEISSQEFRYFAALVGAQNYRVNDLGQLEISDKTENESGVLIFDPQ